MALQRYSGALVVFTACKYLIISSNSGGDSVSHKDPFSVAAKSIIYPSPKNGIWSMDTAEMWKKNSEIPVNKENTWTHQRKGFYKIQKIVFVE